MVTDVFISRDLVAEEADLEVVLTTAFLELDKALARHLHFSPDGKSCTHTGVGLV